MKTPEEVTESILYDTKVRGRAVAESIPWPQITALGDAMQAALTAAVDAERERCAILAENTERWSTADAEVCDGIAAAIRGGAGHAVTVGAVAAAVEEMRARCERIARDSAVQWLGYSRDRAAHWNEAWVITNAIAALSPRGAAMPRRICSCCADARTGTEGDCNCPEWCPNKTDQKIGRFKGHPEASRGAATGEASAAAPKQEDGK